MVRQVPELILRLEQDHWATREEAARALQALGAEESEEVASLAVPRIGRHVEESNWRVREAAATALGHISHSDFWGRTAAASARGAVPELARKLASEDLHVRRAAKEPLQMLRTAGKLGDLNATAAAAVPDLLRRLQDEDWMAREAAASALAEVGASAAPALPELARRLADVSDKVRHAAKATLERLEAAQCLPDLPALCSLAVPDLVQRLSEEDWRVRCTASWALGVYGGSAVVAAPALSVALTDGVREVRALAVEALGNLGLAAMPALPEMGHRLGDNEECVRTAAREAIERVHRALASRDRSEANLPVPARLLRRLEDPDEVERVAALQGLAELGVASVLAVPRLAGALLDTNPLVSEAAGKALAQLREAGLLGSLGDDGDIDRPPPVPLAEELSDVMDVDGERWEVRLAAAEALANLTLKAARVVQPLARRLHRADEAYVQASRQLLTRLGEQGAILDPLEAAENAAPMLVERYASDDPLVHGLASEALRKLHAAGLLDDLGERLQELEEFLEYKRALAEEG